MQSGKDGIPMERINLDDLLPGEDSMQRSDLIADPYASEPEKIMEEAENRKSSMKGCGAYQNVSGFICCIALALRMI